MSIDVGEVGAEWLVVILAIGVLIALIGGPLRDVGWRRGIEAELRIAERMRDLASSDDDVKAARRFASRVISKADDLARRSSNLHAIRNLAFRLPITLALFVIASCIMLYAIVWGGRDPSNIPLTLIATLACGLVCDLTRPAFLLRKRPDGNAGRVKQKRDKEIDRRE
ncbi:MAG TPA: hypothetical protein IAC12_03635 [Candidatus Aphodovivens avistercoris]|nr:hypothetical protein [Candidatus Aphodovivens avistercoris]